MHEQLIRVNDPTDHSGKVTASGAPHFTIDGIAVALKGDPCSCPKKGHKGCVIAEGDPDHTVDGVPVAYEGHKTTCGATLISTAANFDKS